MRSGFSFIEILIVVAIASSLVFVVSSFTNNFNALENIVTQKLQSRSDIEQTLQILTSEIRSAGPSSAGAYAITSATSTALSFYSDIDKNGTLEKVRYVLGTSTIDKGITKPTGTPATYPTSSEVISSVVDHVVISTTTPLFTYYGTNYTGIEAPLASTTDVTQIRVIRVRFYADINPGASPRPAYFSATINVRNLRSN